MGKNKTYYLDIRIDELTNSIKNTKKSRFDIRETALLMKILRGPRSIKTKNQ